MLGKYGSLLGALTLESGGLAEIMDFKRFYGSRARC